MKVFPIALLSIFSTASAWTTTGATSTSSTASRTTSVNVALGMASRSAQKKASRNTWAESRGVTDSSNDSPTTTNTNTEAGFSTIIGGGRIGSLLHKGNHGNSLLLKRGDTIPSNNEGTPIFIATRNDSLDDIIDNCPPNRLADLVFLQNGYLDSYLNTKKLNSDTTQCLLYLSVPALGVNPVDGITAVTPEGLTAATGVHAQALADLLGSLDLKCNVVGMEEYRPAMFEKLIWISTYMLVGRAKECTSVGQAGTDHTELVETVITELLSAVSTKEGIVFPDGALARLAAYTDVVADFPCGVKEFEWRNEYFYALGDEACPTHNGLLKECQEKGLIDFELP